MNLRRALTRCTGARVVAALPGKLRVLGRARYQLGLMDHEVAGETRLAPSSVRTLMTRDEAGTGAGETAG